MKHSLVVSIFKDKYESVYSYDIFVSYLKEGLVLLNEQEHSRSLNMREMKAKNIALEYNMELMLSKIIDPMGYPEPMAQALAFHSYPQ